MRQPNAASSTLGLKLCDKMLSQARPACFVYMSGSHLKRIRRDPRCTCWFLSEGHRHCDWRAAQPKAALTQYCDGDVGTYCALEKDRSRGVWSIGAVGRCLAKQLALGSRLNSDCEDMIRAAAPAVSGLIQFAPMEP